MEMPVERLQYNMRKYRASPACCERLVASALDFVWQHAANWTRGPSCGPGPGSCLHSAQARLSSRGRQDDGQPAFQTPRLPPWPRRSSLRSCARQSRASGATYHQLGLFPDPVVLLGLRLSSWRGAGSMAQHIYIYITSAKMSISAALAEQLQLIDVLV